MKRFFNKIVLNCTWKYIFIPLAKSLFQLFSITICGYFKTWFEFGYSNISETLEFMETIDEMWTVFINFFWQKVEDFNKSNFMSLLDTLIKGIFLLKRQFFFYGIQFYHSFFMRFLLLLCEGFKIFLLFMKNIL